MGAHRRKINTGDRFNLLTIVNEIESYINPSSNQKIRRFECQCDCGIVKNITLAIENDSKNKLGGKIEIVKINKNEDIKIINL